MKILVLANAMNTLSGGDKRFVEIFRRISAKGHLVKLMLPRVGYNICKDEHLEVSYQVLPGYVLNNLSPVISNFLRTILSCILVIKNYKKFDVIYSSSDFINDTFPALCLKLLNRQVKWVSVTHYLIPKPSERNGNYFANLFSYISQQLSVGFMKRLVDRIITSSLYLKKQLVFLGVPEEKINVGSNGVDIKYIDSINEPSIRHYDACFAARIHPSKGVYDVLDAWELVCQLNPNAKLVMVGYGNEATMNELRARIAEKRLTSNVELTGFKKSPGVYEYMKKSKLFIYGDTENGWGIAIAEAMASKCAVLAYNLPVYREVFEDYVAYVSWRNKPELAQRVLALLSNEKLIGEIGYRSRIFVNKYDWDTIANCELENIKESAFG